MKKKKLCPIYGILLFSLMVSSCLVEVVEKEGATIRFFNDASQKYDVRLITIVYLRAML
jgi:hypothetical protein